MEGQEHLEDEYKIQALKNLIIAEQQDPDPGLLHSVAAIYENAVARYTDTDRGTSSHNITHLSRLIWGDEKFSGLLPSFLQNEYLAAVKVATARLFSSCSPWKHQKMLKHDVLPKVKVWVRNEVPRLLAHDCYQMHETGRWDDLDSEMMGTYYTGLLAAALVIGDNQLEANVLTCELPAKLLQYLHIRVSDKKSIGAEYIADSVKLAGRVAESEAKAANALAVAERADDDDAVEVDKTAAFEGYRKISNEEKNAELLRLAKLREKFCIQCLFILKKHKDVLDLVLSENGVHIMLMLLQKSSEDEKASRNILVLPHVLTLIRQLLVERKFAKLFVEGGGVEKLLDVMRSDLTFEVLSSCLLRINLFEKIRESMCARPASAVDQLVELVVQLLQCQHYQARRKALLCFVDLCAFRPVINVIDEQNVVPVLLHFLHDAGLVVAAWAALENFFTAKFLSLADSLHPSIGIGNVRVDLSPNSMDDVLRRINNNRDFSLALMKNLYPAVDAFLGADGHITLLRLYQDIPADDYWSDVPLKVFRILSIITLIPDSHKLIFFATMRENKIGADLIFDVAADADNICEVTMLALRIISNLVHLPWTNESEAREIKQDMRVNRGLNVLISLLKLEGPRGDYFFEWIWALTCRSLTSFARENTMADAFRKLHLPERLIPVAYMEWLLPEVEYETKELLKVQPCMEGQEYLDDEYKIQALKNLIIAEQQDPDAGLLHSVAAIYENAVARYTDTDRGTSSHNITHLSRLIWRDEKFSRLLPSFLQNEYLAAVKVATARLFSSCSPWMHRDILKHDVLPKVKVWVRNEVPRLLAHDCYQMHETGRWDDLDSEMMGTYYTGLLAAALVMYNQLEANVLTCELPAKLLQYLHIRVSDKKSIGAEYIADSVKLAGRAAESEAKAADALAVAERADDDDAVEVDKTAAFEGYRKISDEEKNAELLRLAKLREKFCIQCLFILKRHKDVLDLVLSENGVHIMLMLLQKSSEDEKASRNILVLTHVLMLIRQLVVEIKFAKLFVEGGGVEKLICYFEVTMLALRIISNLVHLPWTNESEAREIKQDMRVKGSLNVLIWLLKLKGLRGDYFFEWIWALTCRSLTSFARENTMADAFRKLQLPERLIPVAYMEWLLPEVEYETKELLKVLLCMQSH